MFLTLYLKVSDLNVTEAIAFNHYCAFSVNQQKASFLKSVHERLYSITRVIIERADNATQREYHCIDFTGRSFALIDKNHNTYVLSQLDFLVTALALEHRVTTKIEPCVLEFSGYQPEEDAALSSATFIRCKAIPVSPQRHLNEHEQYFHEYARAIAAEYFIGV